MINVPKRGGASWQDRLESLTYTSPSGTVIEAFFDATSEEVTARGKAWEFPGVDGVFVQRTGVNGREFPTKFIFSGADHDQRAAQCIAALSEPGFGKLQTPLYGKKTVAPLGKIKRSDDLVRGANQSIVEVTLFETLETLKPDQSRNAEAFILNRVEEFNAANGAAFKRGLSVDTTQRALRAINAVQAALRAVKQTLDKITRLDSAIRSGFSRNTGFIESSLSTLIGTPLALAASFASLTQLPGQFAGRLADKFQAYGRMLSALLGLDAATDPKSTIPQESENNLAVVSMVAGNALAGMCVSSTVADFDSREQSVAAAIELLETFDEFRDWRESRAEELGLIDDADAADALQKAIDASVFLLIQSSFSLPTQVTITTKTTRGLLELCAELYGTVQDDTLDIFLRSNNFSSAEILEIPSGREVVYYVS